ncbi:hypothetical protein N9Y42_02940 [Mariniblastus sp.]|nr:hypothetical protein [Mariniblastus sp.]
MSEKNPVKGSNAWLHGTSAISSICIWEEGFRVLDEKLRFWTGYLGVGIYITKSPGEADGLGQIQASNGAYLLEVELSAGTRIARIDDNPDQKLLDSLQREFGRQILTDQFSKAIPRNKHLKPQELFALIGHLEKKRLYASSDAKKQVKRWLLRLNYHAYGHLTNDIGILVFDPGRLKVLDVKTMVGQSLKSALSAPEIKQLVRDAERDLELTKEEIQFLESESDSVIEASLLVSENQRRAKLLDRFKDKM